VVEGTANSGIDDGGDAERVDNVLPTSNKAIVDGGRYTPRR
jgi:hypothetical protein